jgi:hypothetical protein
MVFTLETKLIAMGVSLFVLVAGYFVWQTHERNIGYNHAVADIQAANAKAGQLATQGQLSVEDCFTAGGTWDRDNGTCSH